MTAAFLLTVVVAGLSPLRGRRVSSRVFECPFKTCCPSFFCGSEPSRKQEVEHYWAIEYG